MELRPFELIVYLIDRERRRISKTLCNNQKREFTEEFGIPEEFMRDGRRKHVSLYGQNGKIHSREEIKKQLGI